MTANIHILHNNFPFNKLDVSNKDTYLKRGAYI